MTQYKEESVMTRRYVSPGDVIELPSPATVVSGQSVPLGRTMGIALGDYASGVVGRFGVKGIYRVPATNGQAFTRGNQAIWDASESAWSAHGVTLATGDVSMVAIALETKTAGASDTILIHLDARIGTVT
jgi:predicted RecA/RadA family phage recombinase